MTCQYVALNISLGVIGLSCGFWVVGSRNLEDWVAMMNEWAIGDQGPDHIYVFLESCKLISRIALGSYGAFKLLKVILRACQAM